MPLFDRQNFEITLDPLLSDRQAVAINIIGSLLVDRQTVECLVLGPFFDRQSLQVQVLNGGFEAAAQGRVLAPVAEITFIRK
jgi:hypothetical protein